MGTWAAFEEYVGNSQIAARAAQLYQSAGIEKTGAECSPLELDRAARAGDKTAQGLWNALGVELGAALSSVVWVLNPDTIVIGGGVAKAGDLLFEPIRQTIRERTIEVFTKNLRVVPALLGNDAGIIGNSVLALEAAAAARG